MTRPTRRNLLCATLLACALTPLAGASLAQAGFGFSALDVRISDGSGDPVTQAGSHPFSQTTSITLNTVTDPTIGAPIPDGELKDVYVDLPAGFIGDPSVAPTCSSADFLEMAGGESACPVDTVIGTARNVSGPGLPPDVSVDRVFNLDPVPGVAARFGFKATGTIPVTIAATVSPDPPYRIVARAENVPQVNPLLASDVTLWGVPADPIHDSERHGESGLPERAFLTTPRACPGTELGFAFSADSWVNPGVFLDYADSTPATTGCEALGFDPVVSAAPTSTVAESPTGFDFGIDVDDPGLSDPDGLAQSDLKRAVVTLPEGMTVNPASADGLAACSPAQLASESAASQFGAGCPAASKVADVVIRTPLLPNDPVTGSVFLATPYDNPFNSLLAGYIVVKSKARGVALKLPGKIDADPVTGRLVASFDENPQFPFSDLDVAFKTGPRAPLATPQECGTYTTTTELVPWSGGPSVIDSDAFTVPCPGTAGVFEPAFTAGSINVMAGRFSPLVTRVTREVGKELGRIDVTLPKGSLAKLKGMPLCSEAQVALSSSRPGRSVQASPSCPAGSQVGTTTVGAGVGTPFYPTIPGTDFTGRVFLTGPHTATQFPVAGSRQAAYGLAIEVPAVAGPFDIGTVMVRAAIYVDPQTAEVTVVSDQLPRILQGIPLKVRDVRVNVNRPGFALNPSSCAVKQASAGIVAQDGTSVSRTSRFQVGSCSKLRFKPKLTLALTGKKQVKTGKHPGVKATVTQKGVGEAAIKKAVVRLPKALALDPANAQALCEFEDGTKPDLEDHCPKGSIVGRAKATTPLLNKPLAGNVYFVKNIRTDSKTGNQIRTLPMIVVALRGEIAINLKGESSTTKNGHLVNSFKTVPDAPVNKFNLNITGGNNGILTVTRTAKRRINLCAKPISHIAHADINGQNGKQQDLDVTVKTPCPKKTKRRR